MRNLTECQAEVFRRSEMRIRLRRQRRRKMIAACVPLVLCAAVWMYLADRESNNQCEEWVPGGTSVQYSGAMGTDGYWSLAPGTVAVYGDGISLVYNEAEAVQGILDLLDGIVFRPELEDNGHFDIVGGTSTEDRKENYKETGYRILLKRSDGTGTEYFLADSVLIDQTTKEEFHISGDAYAALMDALGISRD